MHEDNTERFRGHQQRPLNAFEQVLAKNWNDNYLVAHATASLWVAYMGGSCGKTKEQVSAILDQSDRLMKSCKEREYSPIAAIEEIRILLNNNGIEADPIIDPIIDEPICNQ